MARKFQEELHKWQRAFHSQQVSPAFLPDVIPLVCKILGFFYPKLYSWRSNGETAQKTVSGCFGGQWAPTLTAHRLFGSCFWASRLSSCSCIFISFRKGPSSAFRLSRLREWTNVSLVRSSDTFSKAATSTESLSTLPEPSRECFLTLTGEVVQIAPLRHLCMQRSVIFSSVQSHDHYAVEAVRVEIL